MAFPTWARWSTRATRESVFSTLFTLLQTATVPSEVGGRFNLASRRLADWEDVVHASQPALFLHQLPQRASQPNFELVEWDWHAAVWIFYKCDNINRVNSGVLPDTIVNNFIDSIEFILQPAPPAERQTLGDRVVHTWIEGDVVWNSGLEDNQAVIVIPITIRVAI